MTQSIIPSFCILHSAFCISLFAAGAPAAKSAYVPLLKPGEAFAPIEDAAVAGVEPVCDTDEVFPAAFVEDFAVDGDMEKAVWQKAARLPEPVKYRNAGPIPYRSDIRLLYSKTALYVGATLWQDMSQMTAKWDQRDQAVWNDDNVEVFLFVPGPNGNRLCQFVLNPINALADLCDGDKSFWVRGCKHATQRFDDRWTMELKLPFDGMSQMDRPVADDFIGVRFCRSVHAPTNAVGTAPMLLSNGHGQRGRFAKLLFSKPEGPDAAKQIAEGEAHRKETLRKRFYARFGEEKARFEEIRGCAATFVQSTHPVHVEAWAGIRQMEKALDDFEKRFSDNLAAKREIPKSDADAIFAQFAGFRAFASKHAYVVWETDPWERGSPSDLPMVAAGTAPRAVLGGFVETALPDGGKESGAAAVATAANTGGPGAVPAAAVATAGDPPMPPLMPRFISFEQAGNEREQVCLNIAGVLCGPRLDLRLHPQSVARTKTQPFLSTDKFEIYEEPFVRFGGEVITAPHVRAPGNRITVSPGRTTRVWVVFNSRGVGPGDYNTRLVFKSASDLAVADRDLPVSARVWNFTLPETRDWPIKGFFWGPWSFAEDEVALLELTHDYHVTHGWTQKMHYQYGLYDDFGWYGRPDRNRGKVDNLHDFEDNFALHGNEAFLRRAKELGMRFVVGWGTPTSVAWFKTFSQRLLDMGFGYDDFVFHGLLRDEFSKADIPKQASLREEVRNWSTNLTFMATYLSTPPPTGATMDDIEEAKLPEFFKQWAVINGRCRDPKEGPDTIGRLKAKGCQVWTYNCAQFMVRQPILSYYRFYPWDAYMRGLDGFAFWTVLSPHGDDGWDSRDGYDDGLCWRGLDKKPVPTKMLEAVREGLEDVAYMDRLAKTDNEEARALLEQRAALIAAKDQKQVDAWRLAAGRLIDGAAR